MGDDLNGILCETQPLNILGSEHPNSSIYGTCCQQQNEAREHRAGATVLLCLVSVHYPHDSTSVFGSSGSLRAMFNVLRSVGLSPLKRQCDER